MLMIDELAYASPLRKLSPKLKMLFGALPLVLCLGLDSVIISFVTGAVMAVIAITVSKISLKKYLKLLLIPFSFLVMGTVTIVVVRYPQGTEMLTGVSVGNYIYGVTGVSLQFGLSIILKALGAISCMYFITVNTPMNDILAALRTMKVPPLLVTLMELIYRYIYVILDESHKMRIAQNSRLGYVSFKASIRSLGVLAGTLFLRAYLRSDRIYAALESRGYDGNFKTLMPVFSGSKKMVLCMVVFNALLVAIAVTEKIISVVKF